MASAIQAAGLLANLGAAGQALPTIQHLTPVGIGLLGLPSSARLPASAPAFCRQA
jgi:hypothetical protein